MNVYKLTLEQKNLLEGKEWGAQGQLFNPTLDADGNIFISIEEVEGCTLAQSVAIGCNTWLLSLPLIPFNPIVNE